MNRKEVPPPPKELALKMNGKRYGMSFDYMVPEGMILGRMCCDGLEKLEGRYVFGFKVPSKDTPGKEYRLTYDPLTTEIFHQCTATQTQYCSKAGMVKYGAHTNHRPWPCLCRHSKKIKAWCARNREALKATRKTLREVYEIEREMREVA